MPRPNHIELRKEGGEKDLRSQTFGRLTVIDYIGYSKRLKSIIFRHYWKCECSCSQKTVLEIEEQSLLTQNSESCGCIRIEDMRKRSIKHGLCSTIEYDIWCGIKKRCYDKNDAAYPNYGGRGIVMSDEWVNDPAKFCEDVGKRPSKNYSIDRINNNGNYEKDNVKWSTRTEQCNNKRDNVYIEYMGENLTVSQWSDKINLKMDTIYKRINRGWTSEQIITTPNLSNKKTKISVYSEQHPISDEQYLNSIFGDH